MTSPEDAKAHFAALSLDPALSPSTLAIHAADPLNPLTDVSPPIHVTTTFRYAPPLIPAADWPESSNFTQPPTIPHAYSRHSTHTTTALEVTLSALLAGHATVYGSGLAAFFALLTHIKPKRLLLSPGYHGCVETARIFSRLTGMETLPLDGTQAMPGDLLHLETPQNPHGTAHSIEAYAKRAHDAGALLSVDATFAPPPLQEPFQWGADWVMHSVTKYFGGHSDMLGGVLVTRDSEAARKLKDDRTNLGNVMGGLEGWLGIRSVKTLELRVMRQAENTVELVKLLKSMEGKGVVKEVRHASLQTEEWVKRQHPNGGPAVFSVLLEKEDQARELPGKLKLWMHATSLGGVESLIEWRAMSDSTVDRALLRLSVGVEDVKDLRADLEQGIDAVKGL